MDIIRLSEEQDKFWTGRWSEAQNEMGLSEDQAIEYADQKTIERWPWLAQYPHWE